jgi:hypothetical protein
METIRELMIEHGASISYIDKVCTIRINADYPYKSAIDVVLCQLRSLIYSSQYVYKCLRLKDFQKYN